MNPHQLAEQNVERGALYARLSERLGEILSIKPKEWLALRETCKSDTATEKKWAMTDIGIEETILRLKMKALEKEISTTRAYLDVLSGEARAQW